MKQMWQTEQMNQMKQEKLMKLPGLPFQLRLSRWRASLPTLRQE